MTLTREDPLSSFLNPPHTSSPHNDSYLNDHSQAGGSASGSFSNDGILVGGEQNEADFGFTRPDFRQAPLVGTVEFYERHVFLCYKHPQVWPPRIEAAEFDRLPRLLSAALTAKRTLIKKKTRLTICEGNDGSDASNGDVLIFPDMIRYRRLTHFDVETFVEEVIVKDGEWMPGAPETLRGWFIFVCCHGTRDKRCGVCGPAVISRFKEEIESRGLTRKVSVSPCSHIGGHKYAGNVIIYGPNLNKKITGHWYGYITPDEVPMLLENHIGKREIVDALWRGEMGLTVEEQVKSQELRVKHMEKKPEDLAQIDEIRTQLCGSQENTGCCQMNGGSACCQSPLSPEGNMYSDLDESAEFSAAKKMKKQESMMNKNGSEGLTKRVFPIPPWYETWEREDTYAVLSVACAALSVAFAYTCYKMQTK